MAVPGAGAQARACLEAVYRNGGEELGRVIAVCDPPSGPGLRFLQDQHASLVVLCNGTECGFAASSNRGLLLRERDVVLLRSDTLVTPGWLAEMLEVLGSSDRIASVAAVEGETDPAPRFTEQRTAEGSCLLLRHWVLNAAGCFDATAGDAALEDWAMRAQRFGLRHVRANRARVQRQDLG